MKLKTGIFLLLLSCFTISADVLASTPSFYDLTSPGFFLGITGLYWKPSVTQSDYALNFANVTSAGTSLLSDNNYHQSNAGNEWYYQVFAGYTFSAGRDDICLSYTNFNDNGNNQTIRLDNGNLLPSLSNKWPRIATVDVGEIDVIGFVPTPPLTVQVTFPFLPFQLIAPSTIAISITPDFATAKTDLRYSAVDLTLGKNIRVSGNWQLHWYNGLRYAHLRQGLDANYFGSATEQATNVGTQNFSITLENGFFVITVPAQVTVTSTTTVNAQVHEIFNQKSQFQGLGPYLGFDLSYHFTRGLGFRSSISTSLLIGNTTSSAIDVYTSTITAINTVTTAPITPSGFIDAVLLSEPGAIEPQIISTQESLKYDNTLRIVPNIDLKLALTYDFRLGNNRPTYFAIEAGWMVSHYFNPIDRLSLIDIEQPENRSRNTLDVDYQGPYLSLGVHV